MKDMIGYLLAGLFGLGCVLGALIVAVILLRDMREIGRDFAAEISRCAESLDTIEKAVDRLP